MALLDKFLKQPDENKKYQIDYSEWLAVGQTITSVAPTIALINAEAGDVGEPTLVIDNTNIIGGTLYEYFASVGTDAKRYKVTFLATASNAEIQESEIEFKVDDI